MPTDFIPPGDQALRAFAENFSALITANPTSYGVTAAIATVLAGKYSAYESALAAATAPETRGGSTVLAKDIARLDLVSYCRAVARAVQGTMTVTNQQRFDLGLTVRDAEPTPIPPPAMAPSIVILSTVGNAVGIRLIDPAHPTRRGKPLGVEGASVFSYVGASAPAELTDWTFEGNATRTSALVTFPASVAPGAKVWFTAFWYNPRAQRGPTAVPVTANVPGGGAMAA